MSKIRSISIYLWNECIQWHNIRLPDAENHYVMRVYKFVVMNTRIQGAGEKYPLMEMGLVFALTCPL